LKDLYAKLGIDRGASAAEIQAAFAARPELSEYSTILLHEEKRAVYDSAHSTLKMIGALRLRLGLDSGPSWFLENCLDYAPRPKMAKSPQDAGERTEAASSPGAQATRQPPNSAASTPPAQSTLLAKQMPNWLVPAAVVIIGLIALAVLLL
jgi:hypothetical protein